MWIRWLISAWLLTASMTASAALVVQGSRVIYDENQGEAVVHLQYIGQTPILLQAWLDQDEEVNDPSVLNDIPFIVNPAVARMEPGNGQSIRILRSRDGLPQDRESLFFFNTLEVPPAADKGNTESNNFIQIAFRGRWKFFYRPKGLPFSAARAPDMLQFSLDTDGRAQVRIHNPSPYHVTISNLELRRENAPVESAALLRFNDKSPLERMVAPMAELLMPLEWAAGTPGMPLPSDVEVHYITIGDMGSAYSTHKALNAN